MARLFWIAAALSLCVAASIVTAQEADTTPKSPRLSAHGQVVDPEGRPVVGARVVLREWPSTRRSDYPYEREVRDILAETKSGTDGQFEFTDVPSRPFKGFRERSPWDVVAFVDGLAPGWAHLDKPNDERALTLKLSEAKEIVGRLVDEDGNPVVDCKVQVAIIEAPGSTWHSDFDDSARLDLWSCELTPRATTDKDGQFRISGVPVEKRLTLLAEHPDFVRGSIFVATTNVPQSPVDVPTFSADGKGENSPRTVHLPGFTEPLKRGGRIDGRVVLADTGKPAKHAKVNATWQNRAQFTIADKEGRFTITGLVDPKLNVTSSTDEPAGYLSARESVSFSEGTWRKKIEMRLPRGESVHGRVVDEKSGVGVKGVRVSYILDTGDGESWSPTKSPNTDETGRFEIAVPTGSGEIRVYTVNERHATYDVPDFWRWRSKKGISPDHSATINVVAGQSTDEVVLKVGRGLEIRGSVVDERGKPVFAALVQTSDRFGRSELARKAVTDDQGRFELSGFPPHEEQRIDVSDPTTQVVGDAVVPADEQASASRVVELPPIQLRGTGRVVGKVLGDGKPLADAKVTLQRETEAPKLEGIENRAGQSWWTTTQTTTTDIEGRYEFELVDAGRNFMISVRPDGYTDKNSRIEKIKAGETFEVPALEVKSRAAFVAGIVVDPDGNPVEGATVSASERDGGSISFGRRGPAPKTGRDGRFRLDDLPNVPLQLLVYIQAPPGTKDRTIHFPSRVNAEPNQADVRVVLDPKLQRPLP